MQHHIFEPGDPLVVTILRGGYWSGTKFATFLNYTRTGRITVKLLGRKRTFNPENVTQI